MEADASKVRLPTEVEFLLQEFEAVFETPIGLPPLKCHEHPIILKEGVEPVC